jgi:hypothetical protein
MVIGGVAICISARVDAGLDIDAAWARVSSVSNTLRCLCWTGDCCIGSLVTMEVKRTTTEGSLDD